MRLLFSPADLSLEQAAGSEYILRMKDEVLGRFRSQKQAVNQFNRLRRELESQLPPTALSDEEKRALFRQCINDGLLGHNSIRTPSKKAAKSRTFG